MVCEWKDRLVRRMLICQSSLQWRQDPHAAPAMIGLLKQDPFLLNNQRVILGQPHYRRPRFLYRKGFRIFCTAESFDGTNPAFWQAWKANQRAEIDKRGIVDARSAFWDKRSRQVPKRFATNGSIDRPPKIKQARQNAGSIGFDNRDWLIESERRDGVRSVTSNAGQDTNCRRIAWKSAVVAILDCFGGRVQLMRSCVIPEALPRMEDLIFRSSGDRAEIGEAAEPLIIIRDHTRDLGLLEHEFRGENGVRILGAAPGEVPAVMAIPIAQRAAKLISLERHRWTQISTDSRHPNAELVSYLCFICGNLWLNELVHAFALGGTGGKASRFARRTWVRVCAETMDDFLCAEKQVERRSLRKGTEGACARQGRGGVRAI